MNEQQYYAFVLGYDLLNKYFSNSRYPECDIVFNECNDLARRFMHSKLYRDNTRSSYENLQEWVNENIDLIQKHYEIIQDKPLKRNLEVR